MRRAIRRIAYHFTPKQETGERELASATLAAQRRERLRKESQKPKGKEIGAGECVADYPLDNSRDNK